MIESCGTSGNTLKCLRTVDTSLLQAANLNITLSGFFGTFVFSPVVDGSFIVERPVETLRKGHVNGVRTLMRHLLLYLSHFNRIPF